MFSSFRNFRPPAVPEIMLIIIRSNYNYKFPPKDVFFQESFLFEKTVGKNMEPKET